MAFDFPSGSLTVGQIVTGPNGIQFQWDGTKWESLNSAGAFLPLIGGTLTGPLTLTPTTAGNSTISLNDAAGNSRQINFETAGSMRWQINTGSVAESGGNAGSNLNILNYNDSGSQLGTPFTINRVDGSSVFKGNLGGVVFNGVWYSGGTYPAGTAIVIAPPAASGADLTFNMPTGRMGRIVSQRNGAYRWAIRLTDANETGSDTGSDFAVIGVGDTGSTNGSLIITRANFTATFSGTVTSTTSNPAFIAQPPAGNSSLIMLNKPASGLYNIIRGSTNLNRKWELVLGNADAETGGAAGSNFSLNAYDDSNNALGSYLAINRATGNAVFQASSGAVTINTAGGYTQIISNAPPGNYRGINFETNGTMRWGLGCDNGAESGGNAGSNFYIFNYSDGGVGLQTPVQITRSTGLVTLNTGLNIAGGALTVANGATFNSTVSMTNDGIHYGGGNGIAFTWGNVGNSPAWLGTQIDSNPAMSVMLSDAASGHTTCYNFYGLAGPQCGAAYYGGSFVWNVTFSDRRLKSKIKKASKDALAAINRLKVWELDLKPPHKDSPSQHWNWSLIADEVGDVIPSAFVPGREDGDFGRIHDTLRELPLIGALVRAVQQLTEQNDAMTARIKALEARA